MNRRAAWDGCESIIGKIIHERNICELSMNTFGVLVFLTGLVWFLQGINILPGSYMTGQIQWAINGGIAMVVGAGVLFFIHRRKTSNG